MIALTPNGLFLFYWENIWWLKYFPISLFYQRKPRGRNRRGKGNPTLQVTLIVNEMLTDINRVENIWWYGYLGLSLYYNLTKQGRDCNAY
jgi:hypothetical protein